MVNYSYLVCLVYTKNGREVGKINELVKEG